MGASAKWIKSLITLSKSRSKHPAEKESVKSRLWKLWRSGSGGFATPSSRAGKGVKYLEDSEGSISSFVSDSALAAAMATVVRAPHKDFVLIKQKWAAIRIQTAFRGFLARRALRALRAVVRIQAIFRGRQVRNQAAVTLRIENAIFTISFVQQWALINHLEVYIQKVPLTSQSLLQNGWRDSPGSVEEVRSKLQMKQEGAVKRERAIAYANSQLKPRTSKRVTPNMVDKSHGDFNWLDRWVATKPWESRSVVDTDSSGSAVESSLNPSRHNSVKIRRNNISTRISAKPPVSCQLTGALSDQCPGYLYDDSTTSHSSMSSNETNAYSTSEEGRRNSKPSYMSLTQSIKAKNKQQRTHNSPSKSIQRHSTDDFQLCRKSSPLSSRGLTRRSADNVKSLCKDLYPPMQLYR
nr:protein IQ-DOMAIN 1-like [Ipomoea batatas]